MGVRLAGTLHPLHDFAQVLKYPGTVPGVPRGTGTMNYELVVGRAGMQLVFNSNLLKLVIAPCLLQLSAAYTHTMGTRGSH